MSLRAGGGSPDCSIGRCCVNVSPQARQRNSYVGMASDYDHSDATAVGSAHWGHALPRVRGRSLAGSELDVPDDLAGQTNILLLAFKQHHQRDIDGWIDALGTAGVTTSPPHDEKVALSTPPCRSCCTRSR